MHERELNTPKQGRAEIFVRGDEATARRGHRADQIIKFLSPIKVLCTDKNERREIKLALQATLLLGVSLRRVLLLDFRLQTHRFLHERATDRSTNRDDKARRFFTPSDKKYFKAVAQLVYDAGKAVSNQGEGRLLSNLDRATARSKCLAHAEKILRRVRNRAFNYRVSRRDVIRRTCCGLPDEANAPPSSEVATLTHQLGFIAIQRAMELNLVYRKPFSLRSVGLSPLDPPDSSDQVFIEARKAAAMLLRDIPRSNIDAMCCRLGQLRSRPLSEVLLIAQRNSEVGHFYYW